MLKYPEMSVDQQGTPERTEIIYQQQVAVPDPPLSGKTQDSQGF